MYFVNDISIDMLQVITFNGQKSLMLFVTMQKRKGDKDQDSIQSSTTPDPGYHIGK